MGEVEAFGSAGMATVGPYDVGAIFRNPEFAGQGGQAMLLGHTKGNSDQGMAYGPTTFHRGHALTFGRTRGGKGVSAIIPALLTYSGSMVVIDPKGENAWISAQRRREMGHRIVILDPWGEVNRRYGVKAGVTETITNFNPLAALDPADPDFADDVASIAEAFILQTGNDPHWPDSARELTGGLIAAEVQRNPGIASMRSVRKLLRAPLDLLRAAVEMTVEEFPDSVAANKLAAIVETDEDGRSISTNEMGSIRSTARTQTAFLDSASLVDSMETGEDPFDLGELAASKVTLYLVLPVDRLKSHGRWLRMILTLAIKAISKAAEIPKVPVVFMLDELGTISPGSGLSMVEQSYGLMAGLGIRIWAFLQDLPQLKRDYPASWETFIANSSVIQLLNVADNTTAKYFSEYLGNGTINAKTGSWSLHERQYSESEAGYHERIFTETVRRLSGRRFCSEGRARSIAEFCMRGVLSEPHVTPGEAAVFENVRREIEGAGVSRLGVQEWTEDTQLMSRPVLFPWEIVNADPASCIIIMPGMYNLQLQRYVYYEHEYLSKWARHDPNKPVLKPKVWTPPPPKATSTFGVVGTNPDGTLRFSL